MTLKIGVIGNSHLAAFRLGWDQISAEFPGVDPVFFGSPATSMRQMRVEGNALVPTSDLVRENLLWTSGGHDQIPGDMDAYILVGMGFSFIHLMALLQNHRLPEQDDPSNHGHQLISRDFFESAMKATLDNSNAVMIIRMMKSISRSPMFYAPNPYGTNEVLEDAAHDYYLDAAVRNRVFDFYSSSLDRLNHDECQVAPQPTETIADRMFTKIEFSRGSVKLKKGMASLHDGKDYFHMNATFGAVSLREILKNNLGL